MARVIVIGRERSMGVWGTALFSDDTASDIRGDLDPSQTQERSSVVHQRELDKFLGEWFLLN